jgi:hypothetical protein
MQASTLLVQYCKGFPRGTLGTDLSVGVGVGSRIHLVCLSVSSLPPLTLKDAAFSTRTILQSCCAVCLSVVSQQAIRPIRALQAPFPIAWSWHIVTMAACVTLLYGKSPGTVLRACCSAAPSSGFLPLLAPRNYIQLPSGTHCRAHAVHASLQDNCATPFPT